jgi:thiol-disulfide isomerase/thioredoxin
MATRKTDKALKPTAFLAAFLPALAAAVMLSGAIFTIPAGNARAAENTCAAPPPELAKFQPAPTDQDPTEVAFQTAVGAPVTIREIAKDKGAVVNFWAIWCAPCIKEMPELDALHASLAGDGIPVIAVSQDRGGLAKVEPFYAKQGYKNLGIHLDPKGTFARANKVRGLPTTILFGPDGREKGRLEGIAAWNADAVVDFIRACVASKPGG